MFKTAAVILPPNETASEKVTKSFSTAPCPVSVTVIVVLPFVAANVTSPALVVDRIGVMSLKDEPSSM